MLTLREDIVVQNPPEEKSETEEDSMEVDTDDKQEEASKQRKSKFGNIQVKKEGSVVNSAGEAKKAKIVKGYITSHTQGGCVVYLAYNLRGYLPVCISRLYFGSLNLFSISSLVIQYNRIPGKKGRPAEEFVKEYPQGKLVVACVKRSIPSFRLLLLTYLNGSLCRIEEHQIVLSILPKDLKKYHRFPSYQKKKK